MKLKAGQAESYLSERFADASIITRVSYKPSAFEIYANDKNGKKVLVHSRLNGDGFVNSIEKADKIANKIKKLRGAQ